MAANDENIMRDSLVIKRSMLIGIMLGTSLFCITKIFDYGFSNNLGDQYMEVKLNTVGQSMDFVSFIIILIACRPRKTWPAFFTLGINELDFGRERGANG